MAMQSCPSRGGAEEAVNRLLPSQAYCALHKLGGRARLFELLITESDGEYWYNPDTITRTVKLDGLTEHQENVKLTTGYTHCPSCGNDLAPPGLPESLREPGWRPPVGFYDYDIDNVRIAQQFACKECRHQWGPAASGPRDSAIVSTPVGVRAVPSGAINEPKPGTAGAAAWATADEVYADPGRPLDWKAFRLVVIERGVAAGQNEGNVGTELPRWARVRKVFHFAV